MEKSQKGPWMGKFREDYVWVNLNNVGLNFYLSSLSQLIDKILTCNNRVTMPPKCHLIFCYRTSVIYYA